MLHWIYAAIIGLLTGLIARFLLPGSDSMGLIGTMIVGLLGAYVGTAIGQATGHIRKDSRAGCLWSVIGAVVVLILLRMIF